MNETAMNGYPLSAQQARALGLQQALGVPLCTRVLVDLGAVTPERVRDAFEHVSVRHEILRTTYRRVRGLAIPLQVIAESPHCTIRFVDSSSSLQELARACEPIDVYAGPAWSAEVSYPEGNRACARIVLPSCIVDRIGAIQLGRELQDLCAGRTEHGERLQYADYSDWQGELRDSEFGREAREHWNRSLDPTLLAARLPFENRVAFGATQRTSIAAPSLADALSGLETVLAASPQEVLLTLWTSFAAQLMESDRALCGISVDCRNAELNGVLGTFLTRLPLAYRMSRDQSLAEHLAGLRANVQQCLAYRHCFFATNEETAERLASSRPAVGFDYVDTRCEAAEGIRVTSDCAAEELLTLHCTHELDRISLSFLSTAGAFSPSTLALWASQFAAYMIASAASPTLPIGRLGLPSPEERADILKHADALYAPLRHETRLLHHLFEERVRAAPDSIAATQGSRSLNYRDLNSRAEALAHDLLEKGVQPGQPIGVYIERSIDMIVAALGILKAGGAYLPLDPEYPQERLRWMAADGGVERVVVNDTAMGEWPFPAEVQRVVLATEAGTQRGASERAPITCHPASLAYVIYTSGSSGRPKGVMISHANAVASTLARHRFYSQQVDCFLLLSSFSFDSSVAGIFWTLSQGGCLCLPSPTEYKDAEALAALVSDNHVSHLLALPSFYARILDHLQDCSLRCAIVAGESCSEDLPRRHYQRQPNAVLVNEYGPTEGTVWSTAALLAAETLQGAPPIGSPTSAMRVYVVDADLQLVPTGRSGELLIGGLGLSRGYFNRPGFTAERFVADPFGAEPGGRLYRTFDLGRMRPDGALEFLGRLDSQVKIRGFRIELGEIESRLREHRDVRESVVIARVDDATSTKQLVAHVVPRVSASQLNADASKRLREDISDHLRGSLPLHMIPSQYVWLDAIPRMPNGKLDMQALPAPNRQGDAPSYVAPGNAVESALAEVWQNVLNLPRVGIHDNFFALGGDSIVALLMIAQAKQRGALLKPQQIFEHPTIAELAVLAEPFDAGSSDAFPSEAIIESTQAASSARGAFAPLSGAELRSLGLDASSIEDVYPMTPMQHGILLHSMLGAGTGIYHMQDVYRINTAVERDVLLKAWAHVLRRHPTLRTGFFISEERGAIQIVFNEVEPVCEFLDWQSRSPDEQMKALEELLRAERERGFELSQAPLVRARLVQMGPSLCYFVRSNHHILMDAWCHPLLLRDLLLSYRALLANEVPQLPPAPPYRAYIEWLQRQDLAAAQAFWKAELQGFQHAMPLGSTALPDSAGDTNDEVRECYVDLSKADTALLVALAKELGITPNTIVQGAWALTLALHAGHEDVLFGVTTSGRPAELAHAQSMLGLFIQSIPLRVRIDGAKDVGSWLQQLFRKNAELRRFEHLPLVDIRQCSDIRSGPLFHSLFVFENAPAEAFVRAEGRALQVEDAGSRVHTNYPLTIMVVPAESYRLHISYNSTLLTRAEVELLLKHLRSAVMGIVAKVGQPLREISLLDTDERRRLLVDVNRTARDFPLDAGYVSLFERSVERYPSRIAAGCESERWTYAELDTHANRIAHALLAAGVRTDDTVAIWASRGLSFLAAMLGTLKATAAYVPLDPEHPLERIDAILRTSAPKAILCADSIELAAAELLSSREVAQRPTVLSLDRLLAMDVRYPSPRLPVHPHLRGYVIYTSGSTGAPKGAAIEQAGMLNNQISKIPLFGLTDDDVVAQTASQCFDISVWQFLTPLLCGARVEIVPDRTGQDPAELLRCIDEKGITVLESVPALIHGMLRETRTELPTLRWLLSTGEALSASLARQWLTRYPRIPLVNAYGPAECSDDVAMHVLRDSPDSGADRVPLGVPTDNNRLYVLDGDLEPAPLGAIGELYVAGAGVGRGYVDDIAQTADAFVPNPHWQARGERLYRTGDLARYTPEGALEFLGRRDHQVKIRGLRIEPGEIEKRLLEYPLVTECVVVAVAARGESKQLVAYVVFREQEGATGWEEGRRRILQEHLRRSLPDYMVPTHYVGLASLPRNRNGKVDRGALPPVDIGTAPRVFVEPRDELERGLAMLWQELLALDQVSIEDDFFELGGHSLFATQIVSRIGRDLGAAIPLRSVFEYPTIAQLAAFVRSRAGTAAAAERSLRLDTLMTQLEAAQ